MWLFVPPTRQPSVSRVRNYGHSAVGSPTRSVNRQRQPSPSRKGNGRRGRGLRSGRRKLHVARPGRSLTSVEPRPSRLPRHASAHNPPSGLLAHDKWTASAGRGWPSSDPCSSCLRRVVLKRYARLSSLYVFCCRYFHLVPPRVRYAAARVAEGRSFRREGGCWVLGSGLPRCVPMQSSRWCRHSRRLRDPYRLVQKVDQIRGKPNRQVLYSARPMVPEVHAAQCAPRQDCVASSLGYRGRVYRKNIEIRMDAQ